MLAQIDPNHIIEIEIQYYEKISGDSKPGYIAWIKGDDYKGVVVESESIGECVKELGISLIVLEKYRINTTK